MTEQHHA